MAVDSDGRRTLLVAPTQIRAVDDLGRNLGGTAFAAGNNQAKKRAEKAHTHMYIVGRHTLRVCSTLLGPGAMPFAAASWSKDFLPPKSSQSAIIVLGPLFPSRLPSR